MPGKLLSAAGRSYAYHPRIWLAVALLIGAVVYTWRINSDPPGFYIDESSIAYNAHTIAQTGQDEHGIFFPLYFRAFGEFKNPTYIYLLAALDRIFGPSILLARILSAMLGFATALVLGLLAARLSGDGRIGIAMGALTLFDPWLFELSRLVYEVAAFPLLVALFLLALQRIHTRGTWGWGSSVKLAIVLGVLTYTYSIGRLLGPLFAFGLVIFMTRENWYGILRTWILYALTLVPLLCFILCNPNALSERFFTVSYIRPDSTRWETAWEFLGHYLRNLDPRHWVVPDLTSWPDHVPAKGGILVALFVFFVIGSLLTVRDCRRNAWSRFLLFGLLASIVPAALTISEFHTLRLAALPIFVIVIGISALAWLAREGHYQVVRRSVLTAVMCFAVLEIVAFQYLFRTVGQDRTYDSEANYPKVLDAALNGSHEQIILSDRDGYPAYIHAYWYSTLEGRDVSRFRRLPSSVIPPQGSTVLGTAYPCGGCAIISHMDNFSAYTYDSPEASGTSGSIKER